MPLYNSLSPADQTAVDSYYNQTSDLLLDTMIAVNRKRFASDTSDADSANLDAKYADLQDQLGILERQITDVYNITQPIQPPSAPLISSITQLASQLDQLNQNQAVASAYLGLSDQVLAAAAVLAS